MSAMPVSQKKIDGGHIKGAQDVPNVIEFRVLNTMPNGKTATHAFYGHFTTPPSNLQTLAGAAWTAISAAWSTNMAAHMPTSTILTAVHIRDMTSHTNPIFIGTGTQVPGTGALPAMPADSAIVITENVNARGKGLKGRMYIGGWDTSADAGSGTISSAANTACNAYGTAIQNFLQGQNLTPCIAQVHRQQYQGTTGAVHPERLAGFIAVNSYTVNNTEWDSQRRRGL